MPSLHTSESRVPCAEIERMVRAAWEKAGRTPAWSPPRRDSCSFSSETVASLRPHAAFVGWIDDIVLARRSGLSWGTITSLRRACGIPACRTPALAWTAAQARTWAASLRSGTPITYLAERAGVSATLIRAFASTIGWHRSWTRRENLSEYIGCLRRTEVLRRCRQGESFASIAKRAGCTGENIRQVASRHGLPARAVERRRSAEERQRRHAQHLAEQRAQRLRERAARKQAKRAHLRTFLTPAHRQWQRGHTIARIAQRYGMPPNSMAWWIFKGRTELGWFPQRRPAAAARRTTTRRTADR